MISANPISPDNLLSGSAALVIAGAVLFAECGLLLGFFLPGDTLLLAIGIDLATGSISGSLTAYLVVAPLAALAGNLVGYAIGRRAGPTLFDRPDSRWFKPEYADRTARFYARFGSWAVLLARFVAVVRTVATVMAGVGRMPVGKYVLASALGAVIWADGVLLVGRALGNLRFVRDNKGYVDYLVLLAILISVVPLAVHYRRTRQRGRRSVGGDPLDARR